MEKKPKHFLKQPEFPGGPKAMTQFIYQHLRYPPSAAEARVEGVVLLEYEIDFQGLVGEVRVLQSLGYGCDEEAIRVIRLMKFDVGKNRGVKVTFHKRTRIQFKLPKPAPKPVAEPVTQTVAYQVVKSEKPAAGKPSSGSTYGYTITFGGEEQKG